jgi:hypothetical protein
MVKHATGEDYFGSFSGGLEFAYDIEGSANYSILCGFAY